MAVELVRDAVQHLAGHQLPLEAYGMVAGRAASARLSIAKVVCA